MAQNIAKCNICESSINIKWKSIKSGMTLCNYCKEKMDTFKTDEVISLEEFTSIDRSEAIRKVDLENIHCNNHQEKKAIIYCKKCKQMICEKCLIEQHKDHQILPKDEFYDKKMKTLKDLYDIILEDINTTEAREKAVDIVKSEELANYNEIKQKIKEKEKKIISAAENEARSLTQDLERAWKIRKDILSTEEKIEKKNNYDLQQKKYVLEQAFRSKSAMVIVSTCDNINQNLPKYSMNAVRKQELIFFETPIDTENVIGSILKVQNLRISKTFIARTLCNISLLITLPNGTNVCYCNEKQSICKFKLTDSHCIETKDMHQSSNIRDITITKDGSILYTPVNSSDVLALQFDGKVKKHSSYQNAVVLGIHATDKNIILGLMEKEADSQPKEHEADCQQKENRSSVILMNMIGTCMRKIEYGINNERLFSFPGIIESNINGDIIVIDSINYTGNWDGRLVVLGLWGQLNWIYEGHSETNQKTPFTPCDCVTTSAGMILVADRDSHTIHTLSMYGDFLTSLSDEKLRHPLSLAINAHDNILIGCAGNNEGAKVHLVTLDNFSNSL